MVMGEIRNFMDDVSRKYEQKNNLQKNEKNLLNDIWNIKKSKKTNKQNEQQQNQKIDGSNNVISEENTTEKKALSADTQ